MLAGLMLLALSGCGETKLTETEASVPTAAETTEPTVPATVPADGNPEDVTCKGTYTSDGDASAAVATVGDKTLTAGQLWAWYYAEAAQYRQTRQEPAPDFDKPLDTQPCEIDDTVGSWQQYFLKRALTAWHSAQALELKGRDEGLPLEDAYKPNEANLEKYMTGMPVTDILYGYNKSYQPNSLHQAYLDNIPQMLEELAREKGCADAAQLAQSAAGTSLEDLAEFVRLYNYGYMYFTSLSYYIEYTDADVESFFIENEAAYAEAGVTRSSGNYVDIRHILLPTEEEARSLLSRWQRKTAATEATFADLANKNSQDSGTARDGGAYHKLCQGQLIDPLGEWCFDPSRQPGDTAIITTEIGCHILYFSSATPIWYAAAEEDLISHLQASLLTEARERYPADIDYSAITLPAGEATVSTDDILYPDIAHQRYPEVPLYLQQNYLGTMFGGDELRTHGCGITTFSMLSSYMTDEEYTPPEMCARYWRYSYGGGTDGMLYMNEPPVLGYYLIEKTYEPSKAKEALESGHIVISIQHKGYWTTGGHYILFEKMTEDGMVQVRDSNIFNYAKLPQHKEDKHTWFNATYSGSGYWIFEKKVVTIPACARCGEGQETTGTILAEDYTCHKCAAAILRRSTWLENAVY